MKPRQMLGEKGGDDAFSGRESFRERMRAMEAEKAGGATIALEADDVVVPLSPSTVDVLFPTGEDAEG